MPRLREAVRRRVFAASGRGSRERRPGDEAAGRAGAEAAAAAGGRAGQVRAAGRAAPRLGGPAPRAHQPQQQGGGCFRLKYKND